MFHRLQCWRSIPDSPNSRCSEKITHIWLIKVCVGVIGHLLDRRVGLAGDWEHDDPSQYHWDNAACDQKLPLIKSGHTNINYRHPVVTSYLLDKGPIKPKTTIEIAPAPIIIKPILVIACCGIQAHWSMAKVTIMVSSKTKLQRKEKLL